MEVEFVEFARCEFCQTITDLFCVGCEKKICVNHFDVCVQCEQPVCKECYKEDLCCLARPWGEKIELHLKEFYQNKLIAKLSLPLCNVFGKKYREAALKRTIAYRVDCFEVSCFVWCNTDYVRYHFPCITKYVENEESRSKFVAFMEDMFVQDSRTFCFTFLNENVREELLSVMDESFKANREMLAELIYHAMDSKELFASMKNRGLLHWNLVDEYSLYIPSHFDALFWIQENGIDVVNNGGHFKHFAKNCAPNIMEYLIVEKGMSVEYMYEHIYKLEVGMLEMIYRLKGLEEIQRINPKKILFAFASVRFLRSIGYKFDKTPNNQWPYAFICFKVSKFEESDQDKKIDFKSYAMDKDIKAVKHLFPYMKEIRKKKIMTVLLCMRETLVPKEIIWNIIDLAYSPINERGS